MPPDPAQCRWKTLPRRRLPADSIVLEQTLPSVRLVIDLAGSPEFFAVREPTRGPFSRLLAALLHVRADELLGVLLEHLVDLVQDRVHVVGELLVPLLDLLRRGGLVFLGLLGTPRRLPLAPGVLRRHLQFLRPLEARAPRQLQRYPRPLCCFPTLFSSRGTTPGPPPMSPDAQPMAKIAIVSGAHPALPGGSPSSSRGGSDGNRHRIGPATGNES